MSLQRSIFITVIVVFCLLNKIFGQLTVSHTTATASNNNPFVPKDIDLQSNQCGDCGLAYQTCCISYGAQGYPVCNIYIRMFNMLSIN